MNKTIEWEEFDGKLPKHIGYYAIHHCYDEREGSMIGCDYFNGKEWDHGYRGVLDYAGPFNSDDEADNFADANDISW